MLGDLIPVMTGIALAARYLGRDEVCLTWIGDGGSSTGVFHEGMNFAAVQRAPLIVVLENNLWAYSTPTYLQARITDYADRAKAYGIPGIIVDGNDAVAVYETTRRAVEMCRAGEGPILIEAKTFRRKGHAQHDPASYVPDWMRKEWEAKDPILRYEKYLTENKLWTGKEKNEILARIDRELEKEREAAEASPLPPPERAAEGVYCEGCHEIRAEWKRSPDEVKLPRNAPAQWYADRQPALEPRPPAQVEALAAGSDNPGHGKNQKHRKQTRQKKQRK